MDTSKRNSTSTIDIRELNALSQLCLTASRRHSEPDLPDSPTDDEISSPTTPISHEAPYSLTSQPHASDISVLQSKVSLSAPTKPKNVRASTFAAPSVSSVNDPPALKTTPSHSRLCRYFCSEENGSLCPSKQKATETDQSANTSAPPPKSRSFKRSLFSKKRRPTSLVVTTKGFDDSTSSQQAVSHARNVTSDANSVATPSLDRSSSNSSTLSSHGSFQSDRYGNKVDIPLLDSDSVSETTTSWTDSTVATSIVYNSAPVSAASSPKLSPVESQRKGIFTKRSHTQPAISIDVSSPKTNKGGIKAAIRYKRETAVLKREAKAIQIWKAGTMALLEAGPTQVAMEHYKSPEKIEKDALMRRFIIQEIYTTEKSYLKNLLIVKTKFMDPMVEAAKLGSPLVRSQDLPILFAHLDDATNISSKIIKRFEHYKEYSGMLWRQSPLRVGKIFIDLNDEMGCYVKYALDYHSLEKALKRAVRNVEYQKFNQDSINNLETNRMGLADYLIMPIQRATRYGLLLKDLKKHTDVNNPDYNDLDVAIKMINALAIAMNHAQKRN